MIEWPDPLVDWRDPPSEDFTQRESIEGRLPRPRLGFFNPQFERPPLLDQTAEDRRKSGVSSGLAPALTHVSNAR